MSIDSLYQTGDDALANQFAIAIDNIPAIAGIEASPIQFRITNLSVPERSIETYSVPYRAQNFTKVGGKITTPNEFSFTFRSDKYWGFYGIIDNWMNYILNYETGNMREDLPGVFRVPLAVYTIDADGTPTSDGWKFTGAFPSNLAGVDFDHDSGAPITVAVTMQFLRMISTLPSSFTSLAV